MNKSIRWLVAALALAIVTSRAAVIYDTEAAFVVNLNAGYYFNNFEGTTPGNQNNNTSVADGNGTFTFTISTEGDPGNFLWVVNSGTLPSGRAMSTTVENTLLRIDFTSGNITAVGANFYLTSSIENQVAGDFSIVLSDGTQISNLGAPGSGAVPFRGFTTSIDNPITSLIFQPSSQYATFDNFYVGEVAPVPEASTTIAAGLLFLLVGGRAVVKRLRANRQEFVERLQ